MGALKLGLKIGVYCHSREAAESFMNAMFNEPDHKKITPYDVVCKYDNGDVVEWINPSHNNRGKKFDFVFYDETKKIDAELYAMVIPTNFKFYSELDNFNQYRENKFNVVCR